MSWGEANAAALSMQTDRNKREETAFSIFFRGPNRPTPQLTAAHGAACEPWTEQTMKSIGAISIAPAASRDFGNSRHATDG